MDSVTKPDLDLIKEAYGYIYHVLFKENFFHPSHDVTVFTLPQLITAFREGFNYLGKIDDEPKRLNLRNMDVLLFHRVGLPDFVELKDVPELALLLQYPTPNV